MKKLICLFIAISILVSMFGCSPSSSGGGQSVGSDSGRVDLHVHEYELVKAVKPTCVTGGNSAYYACDCGKCCEKQVCFSVHLTHFIPFLMSSRCLLVNDFVGDSDLLFFALIALYMLFSS